MDQAPGADRLRLQLDWRQGAWIIAVVLAALAFLAIVANASVVLTQAGIGIIVALALDPLADVIQRRWRLRRGVAVAILGLAILGFAVLLIVVLGPAAVNEAGQFSEQLPKVLDEIEQLPLIGTWAQENDFAQNVQDWIRQLPEQFTDERIAEIAGTLVLGLVSITVVSVVAISALVDGDDLVARFRRLLPAERRPRADDIGRILYRTIGRYFGGSIACSVLHGVWVLALGLVLGVPLAPLAAIFAAITSLIPQVGGLLGGSFFTLLAATQGATTAIIAAVGFVLYMTTDNNVIQPAVIGKTVDLTPPTTMIAAFVGGAVAGVAGALVATPLVGATKAIYLETRGKTKPDDDGGLGFLARVRKVFKRKKPST
ncbi:MAG: AI-2E family transporter [Ilumatobacteraceae bacterium]